MRRVKEFLSRLAGSAAWCPPEAAAVLGTVCGICAWHVPRTAFFLLFAFLLPRVGRRLFFGFAAAVLVSLAARSLTAPPALRTPHFVRAEVAVTDLGLCRMPEMPRPALFAAEIVHLRDVSGAAMPVSGKVLVRLPESFEDRPAAGDVLSGAGVLSFPRDDFAGYVRSRGACGVLSLDECRVTGVRPSWRSMLAGFRERLLVRTVRHIEPAARRCAAASLFFGVKGGIGRASRREMVNAGVIHLYSVSGLHVGIFAGALFLLLRLLPFFRWRYALLVLLTLAYVLSAGANVPAVRAWIMIAVWAGCRAFLRWIPARTVLGYAAAGMLVWEPEWLFDMGFLYSFGITLVLILLSGGWRDVRHLLSFPLPLMPRSGSRDRMRRTVRVGNSLLTAAVSCTAAFLGGAAVGLFFQRRLLPGSVAANILLLPVTLILFPLLMLKLATGRLCDAWDELLAYLVEAVWNVMDAVIALAQGWGATVTGRPPGWSAALFLLGLGLMLWPVIGRKWRAAGGMLVFAVLFGWHVSMPGRAPAVLIVHGGHAEFPAVAVADTRAGVGMIVNVPDAASAAKLAAFLLERGISETDRVIFAAPRSGCAKGLRTLLARMPVRQLVRCGTGRYASAFRNALAEARQDAPDLGETDRTGGVSVRYDGELREVAYRNPATGFTVRIEFDGASNRLRVNGREIPFPHISESTAVMAECGNGMPVFSLFDGKIRHLPVDISANGTILTK